MSKTKIIICQGSSCFSRGNKENLEAIQAFIASHHLQAEIDFKGQLCSELCNEGPVIFINNETHKEVTPEKITALLKKHFNV